jgi:predicted transcriptional regulator
MKIKDSNYLSTRVISIPSTMEIREAFFKLKKNSFRNLSIVDDNNTLIGIIISFLLIVAAWLCK